MEEYDRVWERFVEERRLESGGHTDPDWQEGHKLSASLVVPVEASRFHERLEPLREALRPFPFVSLHPDHFMHITLVLLGFLVDEPSEEDEVSRERLQEIEKRARIALSDVPAFTVRLVNLNAFPGAAFIEVHDGGMIGMLRDTLCTGCGLKKPQGPPHLTVAYFQAPDGTDAPEELIFAIARYRDWPIGELEVENVEMTLLNLRSEYPEPETLTRIPLG
ncbi:MAG: 2'-5' RNA ligase family protein [Actinomycetota bacterium]|nr:2'-5' RNA ligase family protein [Actinomycetota bacterium]